MFILFIGTGPPIPTNAMFCNEEIILVDNYQQICELRTTINYIIEEIIHLRLIKNETEQIICQSKYIANAILQVTHIWINRTLNSSLINGR